LPDLPISIVCCPFKCSVDFGAIKWGQGDNGTPANGCFVFGCSEDRAKSCGIAECA
jgi:hypothetical protein